MTHAIRPREDWIGSTPWDHTVNGRGQFYICPPFKGWSSISDAVIHYPGADFADMDLNDDGVIDLYDTKKVIQQMHHAYLMGSRGYSLGYGFIVGQVGDIWEVRGWDHTNAANLGDKAHNYVGWNNWSISVQIVVDEELPANSAQVDAVNWLLGELEHRKGDYLNLKWHGMGQSTSCAGAGIIAQIKNGTIKAAVPDTQPPPDTEEYLDMAAISAIYKPGPNVSAERNKWFVLRADGGIRHASGVDAQFATTVKAPTYIIEGDEHYDILDRESKASEG